jgi:hypothetical protein
MCHTFLAIPLPFLPPRSPRPLIHISFIRNLESTSSAKTTRQSFITRSPLASFVCLLSKKPSLLPASNLIKIHLPSPHFPANLAQATVQLLSTLLGLRMLLAPLAVLPSNNRLSVVWEAWAPICAYQGRVVSPLTIFSVAFRASSRKAVRPVLSYTPLLAQ